LEHVSVARKARWGTGGRLTFTPRTFKVCLTSSPYALNYLIRIFDLSHVLFFYAKALGTAEGVFFDLDTFAPLIRNEGFVKALDLFKKLMQYGSPDELTIDVQTTRDLFAAGRCAFTLDWADPFGFMGRSPFASGYVLQPMPGSYEVVDRETGRLRNCTTTICPTASPGRSGALINRAPYAAFGGWSGGISKFAPQVRHFDHL
jgi:multiple sugar transport system substrate-binding protein